MSTDGRDETFEASKEADCLLDEYDAEAVTQPEKEPKPTAATRWLLFAVSIYSVVLLLVFVSWNPRKPECHTDVIKGLFAPHHAKDYALKETSCGDNVSTALERGCVFDSMGNNWVPKLCYNARLADEAVHGSTRIANMLGLDELRWYMDRDMTQYIPTDELGDVLAEHILSGGKPVAFVTEKWHTAHCMYMMSTAVNIAHRVAQGERDVWIHHTMINSHHAAHCAGVIGNHHTREHGTSEVEFGYTHCKKIA